MTANTEIHESTIPLKILTSLAQVRADGLSPTQIQLGKKQINTLTSQADTDSNGNRTLNIYDYTFKFGVEIVEVEHDDYFHISYHYGSDNCTYSW